MNEERNTKAAFPVYAKDDGMTLRDYFAAKAMQGFLICYVDHPNWTRESVVGSAYQYADAMMKEREK